MTFEQARAAMREASADLEALRPFLDGADAEIVDAAWQVARARFVEACKHYTTGGSNP